MCLSANSRNGAGAPSYRNDRLYLKMTGQKEKRMNELKIFENADFGKIRIVTIDGAPWFVGKDVALALGYTNPQKAVRTHIDEEDRGVNEMDTPSGRQKLSIINESGMYALILSSKLPSAKKFKHWVTSEVLPAIRKTGSYGGQMDKLMNVADQLTNTAAMLVQATTSIAQSVNRLIDVVDKISSVNGKEILEPCKTGIIFENPDCYSAYRCKLETFPQDITEQVDKMLVNMLQQQNLNFSMIARFCTVNGYSISSPSVKTYFQKHFGDA